MGEHNLKDRKKPKDHRQGKLVKLLDLLQRFSTIQHEKDFYDLENQQIKIKYQEELEDMMRELRSFDVTEIGNLYLTSGGRVVLDKGYGEYFNEGDKTLFTLSEITGGIPYKKFMKRLKEVAGEV